MLGLVAVVVSLLMVGVAWGYSEAVSFDYAKFNTETPTHKAFDDSYKAWQVVITPELVYNTTTGGTCIFDLAYSTDVDTNKNPDCPAVELSFWNDSTLQVAYYEEVEAGINWIEITQKANGWKKGTAVYVKLSSDGKLRVGDADDDKKIVDDYVVGEIEVQYVGVRGSTTGTKYVATSGYATVEITAFAMSSSGMTAWVSPLLGIVMLGICVGMLRKMR